MWRPLEVFSTTFGFLLPIAILLSVKKCRGISPSVGETMVRRDSKCFEIILRCGWAARATQLALFLSLPWGAKSGVPLEKLGVAVAAPTYVSVVSPRPQASGLADQNLENWFEVGRFAWQVLGFGTVSGKGFPSKERTRLPPEFSHVQRFASAKGEVFGRSPVDAEGSRLIQRSTLVPRRLLEPSFRRAVLLPGLPPGLPAILPASAPC